MTIIDNIDNNIQNNDVLNICKEIKTNVVTTGELKNNDIIFNLIKKLDLLVKQNDEFKTKQDEIIIVIKQDFRKNEYKIMYYYFNT